ncbi:MAG: hypothetical protein RL427_552 [Bacteroidota bacterium]|jgi:hypothetical protein
MLFSKNVLWKADFYPMFFDKNVFNPPKIADYELLSLKSIMGFS